MNLYCKNFLSLIIFLLSSLAMGNTPLDFPADRNNILILPQKFEYSLRDASKLLLGNRIIDTKQFQFQILPNQNSFDLKIQWPHNMIEFGRVVILNPSGVSIWSQKFSNSHSSFTIPKAESLIEKLLNLSFFRFCAGHYEIDTGLEVCSPEMTIKGSGSQLAVVTRSRLSKSQVQINGRAVTPHGIVFLNDEKESLSFRATSASGAEFKMDTRRIKLNFVDVLSVDEKNFLITSEGPLPLTPQPVRKAADRWSVLLRKDRPILYVSGDGKVPLRQEFVVQGPLPTEAHRLTLDKDSPKKTYSPQVTLRGRVSQLGTPKSVDDNSEVLVAGQQFSWNLKNVPKGKERISYLTTQDGADVFTASYSVSRQDSSRLEILGGFNTDENRIYFGGEAQLWIEKPPLFESFFTQRLGLGLVYNQDLTGDVQTLLTQLDLKFRLWSGLQFWEPSPTLGFSIQNWSFNSNSLQSTAISLGWMGSSPKWWIKRFPDFDWQESELQYSLPQESNALQLSESILARWKVYQRLQSDTKIRYSLGIFSQTWETTQKIKKTGATLEGAWVMTF